MKHQKYGLMTIKRHAYFKAKGIHIRVIANGDDVTDRCCAADNIRGWANVYAQGPDGKPFLNQSCDIAREIITGNIQFLQLACQRS